MSNNEHVGITVDRAVKLAIDWDEFRKNLIDVVVTGFAATFGAEGPAGVIGSLLKAVTSIKKDEEPGAQIWRLVWLSFGWTLDQLRTTEVVDEQKLKRLVHEALEEAKQIADRGEMFVPISFFERPTTLPLYIELRDSFVKRKNEYRISGVESDADLSAKFDSAFRRAVTEIWIKRLDVYQALKSLTDIPSLEASAFELQWEAYRARLIHEFDVKPMLDKRTGKFHLHKLMSR